MPHSESNMEPSASDVPNQNGEQNTSEMAGNRASLGYDACAENDGVRSENRSVYLSDHMAPNNDVEQEMNINGVNTESVESGRQSN